MLRTLIIIGISSVIYSFKLWTISALWNPQIILGTPRMKLCAQYFKSWWLKWYKKKNFKSNKSSKNTKTEMSQKFCNFWCFCQNCGQDELHWMIKLTSSPDTLRVLLVIFVSMTWNMASESTVLIWTELAWLLRFLRPKFNEQSPYCIVINCAIWSVFGSFCSVMAYFQWYLLVWFGFFV